MRVNTTGLLLLCQSPDNRYVPHATSMNQTHGTLESHSSDRNRSCATQALQLCSPAAKSLPSLKVGLMCPQNHDSIRGISSFRWKNFQLSSLQSLLSMLICNLHGTSLNFTLVIIIQLQFSLQSPPKICVPTLLLKQHNHNIAVLLKYSLLVKIFK